MLSLLLLFGGWSNLAASNTVSCSGCVRGEDRVEGGGGTGRSRRPLVELSALLSVGGSAQIARSRLRAAEGLGVGVVVGGGVGVVGGLGTPFHKLPGLLHRSALSVAWIVVQPAPCSDDLVAYVSRDDLRAEGTEPRAGSDRVVDPGRAAEAEQRRLVRELTSTRLERVPISQSPPTPHQSLFLCSSSNTGDPLEQQYMYNTTQHNQSCALTLCKDTPTTALPVVTSPLQQRPFARSNINNGIGFGNLALSPAGLAKFHHSRQGY